MIAAALSFSCQKEIEPVQNGGADNAVVDFVPGPGRILAVSPTGPDTKITFGSADVNGNMPVLWTNGDGIKVYSENNAEGVDYTFEGEGAASAVFTGSPVEGETRYAVFPYTRAKQMKDGKLNVSFGALYDKQNFHSSLKNNENNLKYMPMWAKEDQENEGHFNFTNLCGAVMFRFNDYQELRGMKISNVTITSKSNYISGVGTIDPATGKLTLSGTEDYQKTITVNHDPVLGPHNIANTKSSPSINDEGVTGFIIALPAITYPENDLKVTITDNMGRVFERVVTSQLVITPGQVRKFPTLSFTFCYGTANCITVNKGETKTFDITPHYSFDKSLAVSSMVPVKNVDGEDFCEEGTTLSRIWEIRNNYHNLTDVKSVLGDAGFSKEGNTVTITGGTNVGNALLALKDSTGTILWSWHIWVVDGLTDQKYTNCVDQGQPTFLDRNLGSYSNKYADKSAVGLYYQYGRKDPFVITTKEFTVINTGGFYSPDVELTEVVERASGNSNMAWTIKNPNKRIVHKNAASGQPPMGFNNWLEPTSEIENNWGNPNKVSSVAECNASKGGYKTIYDPCPAGYRVPDYFYFTGLSKDNRTGESGKGVKFDFDETDAVAVYPLPGTLSVGTYDGTLGKGIFHYNYRGFYWTTTLIDSSAAGFLYSYDVIHTSSIGSRTCVRPAAANIRCMKIE